MKEKIENMPVLVFLLIGVAFGAFNYMGSLSTKEGLQEQISTLTTQLKEKRDALEKARNASAEIPSIQQEIEKLGQSLSRATDYIPATNSARDIIAMVSKEAKDSGVRVPTSKPDSAISGNYFDQLPIDIEFEGSYSQLTMLMYQLSKNKIIVHPVDMELTTRDIVDRQTNLKMKGKIVGFKYKEAKQ